MSATDLVIKSHNPNRNRLIWLGSAAALIVSGYFMYRLGQSKGGFDARKTGSEIRQLNAQNEYLTESNQKLKHQMAMLETGQTIDESSYKQLKITVKSLETKLADQSKELRFYRQIMSPKTKVEGLHVLNPEVIKIENTDEYQLDMVVYQYFKIIRDLRGKLVLTLIGEQNGVSQEYALQNLLVDNSGESPKFNFRYFQSYGLRFVIPEGYSPSAIKIQVVPATSGYKPKEVMFQWTDLLQTDKGN